jgi:hypothetical protein
MFRSLFAKPEYSDSSVVGNNKVVTVSDHQHSETQHKQKFHDGQWVNEPGYPKLVEIESDDSNEANNATTQPDGYQEANEYVPPSSLGAGWLFDGYAMSPTAWSTPDSPEDTTPTITNGMGTIANPIEGSIKEWKTGRRNHGWNAKLKYKK